MNPNSHVGQSGKTAATANENLRPSILATRRPYYNGSGPGKLVDVANGGSTITHPNSHGTYTPNSSSSSTTNTDVGSTGSSNGRPSQRHGTGPNSSNYGNTNVGSSDNLSPGKNQPIRSGTYDTSGNGQTSKTLTGNGLQPYDSIRNRNPSYGKETTDTFDQTHGRTETNHPEQSGGNTGPSSGPQNTDALSGFRNVFKLPPGLCLVKCDSLKPGQAMTSDQIRDSFVSSGLNGKR